MEFVDELIHDVQLHQVLHRPTLDCPWVPDTLQNRQPVRMDGMEMISLQGKTSFFKKRVGEYSKSGVGVDRADQTFALDASF